MRGQLIFVLVFLSFFEKLVLGSLFPTTQNEPQPHTDSVNTQQEVKWPLENISTPAEVIVPAEAKIYSHGLQAEQIKDDHLESVFKQVEISPTITVTNPDPPNQISKSQNNTELETKKLSSNNN